MTRRDTIVLIVIIFLAGLLPELIHQKTVHFGDNAAVVNLNKFVISGDHASIWKYSYWAGVELVYQEQYLYRPMFLSVVSLFQKTPAVLHVMVVLLNSLLGVLFFFMLKERSWLAAGIALLLTLHPANVEVTAQVVGLMEVVPTLLGVGALMLVQRNPWAAIGLAALGPAWKETGFIWLGVVGLVLLAKRKYTPFAAGVVLGCVWLSIRYSIHGAFLGAPSETSDMTNPMAGMGAWDRMMSSFALIGHHLKISVWPYALTSDYSRGTLPLPGYLLHVWTLLGGGFVYWLWWKRKEISSVSAAAMLTLFPTLSFLGTTGIIFAERFSYSFRLGLFLLVFPIIRKFSKAATIVVMALLPLAFFVTLDRHADWTSWPRLVSRDLSRYPQNAKLHFNMGMYFGNNSQWGEARESFTTALNLAPDFPNAHYRLALVYRELGNKQQAQTHWEAADALGYPLPRN